MDPLLHHLSSRRPDMVLGRFSVVVWWWCGGAIFSFASFFCKNYTVILNGLMMELG